MVQASAFHWRISRTFGCRQLVLTTGLLLALLAGGTAGPRGIENAAAMAAMASGPVHVRIQGHIVALSPSQIKVRDRRDVVHTILLVSTTTYWYKLQHKTFRDLTMGMRVYVLGLPGKTGAVTALRIHLFFPRPPKAKGTTG
jgi:hypothetical protein